MLRFFAMIAVSVVALGCGSSVPTRKAAKQVGWVELVGHYRDDRAGADREYLRQTVSVYLPRKSFRADRNRIEAFFGLPNTPGALVFECRNPAPDHGPILVTGICRGIIIDGIERANGVRWFVLMENCTVTELAP